MSRPVLDGSGGAIFEVGRLHGFWQVFRDGVFFEQYRGRTAAIEAARAATRLPVSRPAKAQVVIRDDDPGTVPSGPPGCPAAAAPLAWR